MKEWAGSLSGSGKSLGKSGGMMTLDELKARREAILTLARRRGAVSVRVFGSVARAEADAASGLDFLVELEPGRSLLDLGGLLTDLEELLHCKVDVLTPAMLKPRLRERVLREAVPL
jgi:uncharacterized protein